MTIWILRLVPYNSAANIDACFRDETRARTQYAKAKKGAMLDFSDDFGIEFHIDAKQCACILTNSAASAAMNHALNAANNEANKSAAQYVNAGSSMQ